MNIIMSMIDSTVLAIDAIRAKSIYNKVEIQDNTFYWTKCGSIMMNKSESDIILIGFDKVTFKLMQNLCSRSLHVLTMQGSEPDGWEKSVVNMFNSITDRAVLPEAEVPKLTNYKTMAEYQLEELNQSLEKGEKWLTC